MALKRSRGYEGRPRREDLSAEDLAVVEERNALDRELHLHAAGLLAARLEQAGPELGDEVAVIEEATKRRLEERPVTAEDARAFPHEARVALALAESALQRSEVQARRVEKKAKKRSSEPVT